MIDRDSLNAVVKYYSALYPLEGGGLYDLQTLLDTGGDIFSRKNFTGHIVANGCVIDPREGKVLMIYHKTLKKWLCPGGHIDPGEHPAEAARREVLEETGMHVDIVLDENRDPLLLHIHSHTIPANEAKQEPEHWHHALNFLFLADATHRPPSNHDDGVVACEWMDISELLQDPDFGPMLSKIQLDAGTTS